MPGKWTSKLITLPGLRRRSARFARDEAGTMTIFAVSMIMMMILVCGIGVDIMRNEMERTSVQATIDRAVLAAADLDQTLDPEAVVRDYFDKADLSEFLTSVHVDEGLNFRTVTAVADGTTPTRFMRLMGVDDLPVPARGQAEERVQNVEISLVLDISGSMGRNSKMDNLQDAAKTFVDTVIQDETDDLISVSLIPYTAQVNAGPNIYNELNTDHRHNFSHCIDFIEEDFDTATISFARVYEQMQHFEEGYWYSNPISNPGCPQQDYERILPFSQDKNILKSRIDDYRARANTSIHIGMKWGVALLDPSFRPITQQLSLDKKIDSAFSDRPVAYDDVETIKTLLLMTDGENVNTTRIQDWYYNSASEYAHWAKYPLYWYLNNHNVGSWSNWRYTKYTSSQADNMLSNICDAAKDEGIVVWSIGFEVTNYSAGIMEDCASSPSHFFRVEGIEITEAFEAIAKQINQLRLTQ
ncbi:TadE/TadG family type IV pilus assembly protein [uncultured Tateyamaria sp.]|uniref:TadE/TadG family type IV pilus assembly protein n=1 Tax=uncultured Tateyamaria sp. TaxID=455651 RepID=UPI00261A8864|nr:TadE/TadG family type IV pilus assembly protein [uncultured Tateyamaria sp.]